MNRIKEITSTTEEEKNNTEYPNNFVTSPVTREPAKIPNPIIALLTPRYFSSKPCGMLLKKITEVDVLKIENPITRRQDEIIANTDLNSQSL